MKRRLICDVPRCGNGRQRGHRLCNTCFGKLSGELRVGITEAHHQRRFSDWTALRHRAAEHLGLARIDRTTAHPPRITPQQSYLMQARMLGESVDQ